jgi:predicted metal-dependent peptidase
MFALKIQHNWPELSRALMGVMTQAPFFSCLLYDRMLLVVPRNPAECPTLGTDGYHLYINREYFNKLSLAEQVFALCHEVGHAMLLHMSRAKILQRTGVDGMPFLPLYFNVAGDLVINPMLVESKIGKLKKGWLLDPEVKSDMLVDDVYRWLVGKYPPPQPPPPPGEGKPCEDGDPGEDEGGPKPRDSKPSDDGEDEGDGGGEGEDGDEGEDSDGGGGGQGEQDEEAPAGGPGKPQEQGTGGGVGEDTLEPASSLPDSLKPQDVHEYAENADVSPMEWRMSIETARDHAKSIGKMPAALARVIDKILEPVVDWKRELINLMFRVAGNDEAGWQKPNRRWLREYGIYAPGRVGHRIGPVVIVVDTSASVSAEELKQFGGEMTAILSDLNPEATWLLHVDVRVAHVDEIDNPMDLESIITSGFKGGGGTHMPAAFEWAKQQGIEPDVMVILTDMGTDFGEPQPYPVIWAATTKAEAPHGYTIFIDINKHS